MDAQTATAHDCAAPSTQKPETSLILTVALMAAINAELGGYTLQQAEQQCRLLIKRTAAAALEIGKRLLYIREHVERGQWLPTLDRIGIGSVVASRFIKAAVRFYELGGCATLIGAVDSQSKLFELLTLNDDELRRLDAGGIVRGLGLDNLSRLSVKGVRDLISEHAPANSNSATAEFFPVRNGIDLTNGDAPAVPPSADPILTAKVTDVDGALETSTNHYTDNPTPEEAPAPLALSPSTRTAPTLAESLKALQTLQCELYNAYTLVRVQIGAVRVVASRDTNDDRLMNVADLAEIAERMLPPIDAMTDRLDQIHADLNCRLLHAPGEGERLPESVWLGLVQELSTEHETLSNNDVWRLATHATALARYAPQSPEAETALACVRTYVTRRGAVLYPHAPSNTLSFYWQEGRGPGKRREPAGVHCPHAVT